MIHLLPLIQEAVATGPHPLANTAARWLWAVPMLPLLGFIINGAFSIAAAYHKGPPDPSASHGDDHGHAHAAHSPDEHGAHGDDHHPVVRHRYAALTSIVGSGV